MLLSQEVFRVNLDPVRDLSAILLNDYGEHDCSLLGQRSTNRELEPNGSKTSSATCQFLIVRFSTIFQSFCEVFPEMTAAFYDYG